MRLLAAVLREASWCSRHRPATAGKRLPQTKTSGGEIEQRCKVEDVEVTLMATEIQKTGIDVVGDMVAWGAHFCLFYETKEDLLDTLISYCKSGLEREEYCLWIVAEPLTIVEARAALHDTVPRLGAHRAEALLD